MQPRPLLSSVLCSENTGLLAAERTFCSLNHNYGVEAVSQFSEVVTRSENVLVLLTPAYIRSLQCMTELLAAIAHRKRVAILEIVRPRFQNNWEEVAQDSETLRNHSAAGLEEGSVLAAFQLLRQTIRYSYNPIEDYPMYINLVARLKGLLQTNTWPTLVREFTGAFVAPSTMLISPVPGHGLYSASSQRGVVTFISRGANRWNTALLSDFVDPATHIYSEVAIAAVHQPVWCIGALTEPDFNFLCTSRATNPEFQYVGHKGCAAHLAPNNRLYIFDDRSTHSQNEPRNVPNIPCRSDYIGILLYRRVLYLYTRSHPNPPVLVTEIKNLNRTGDQPVALAISLYYNETDHNFTTNMAQIVRDVGEIPYGH